MSYDCATYPAFDAASTVAPPAYHIPSVYNLRACVAAPNSLTAACCSGVNIGYGGTTEQCGWTVCVTDASDAEFGACIDANANGAQGATFNCAGKIDYPEPPNSTTSPEPPTTHEPKPSTTEPEPESTPPTTADVSSEPPSSEPPSSSVDTLSSATPSSTSVWVAPLVTGSGAPPPASSAPTTVVWRTVTSSSASKSSASATPTAESAAAQRTVASACVLLVALAVLASLQ